MRLVFFKSICGIIGSLLVWQVSWAQVRFEDASFPELIISGRAAAMGNAFGAKVDDSMSSFYNPAGLGTIREPKVHISSLYLECNRDWFSTSTGGKFIDAVSSLPSAFSLDGMRELLVKNPGQSASSRVQLAPNFTSRYLSMGFMLANRSKAALGSDEGSQFYYASRLDYGPYSSLALSLFGGIVKIGVTGIYLRRNEARGEGDPQTKIVLKDSDYLKGEMFNVIGGAKLTLPFAMLPTFAVTMHNMGASSFQGRAKGAPEAIKQAVDVGLSITPQIGMVTRCHWEVNLKDINNAYPEVSLLRKLMLGLELDIYRTLFFRVGHGDGFGSLGIGIKSRQLEFDLTTYAIDNSSDGYRGKEDRRFALGFSTGL